MAKSVTRTLRLDEGLDKAIAMKASREGVSVNSVVNRCIRKYVDWDAPIGDVGTVVIPKLLLDRLANGKDEGAMEEAGREVAREVIKPAAEYILGGFTVESSIEVVRRSSMYSGRFSFGFEEGRDSRKRVLLLRHDSGKLWSRYYFGMTDEVFRVLLGERISITCTDSLCVVQLAAR